MISVELQSLSPTALLEFFILDTTATPGGQLTHFHSGTNELQQSVVWQGVEYKPLPVDSEGFDVTVKGSLPRPKLRVANLNGLFSQEVREKNDLIGAKIIRKRTFAKYLDAVNFADGNPDANPNQHLQDDVWFVDQKVQENKYVIEWELASAFDLQDVMLPRRQVIQNTCAWRYRGPDCNYTGAKMFDTNDMETTVAQNDVCGKRLSSCELRFPKPQIVRFGGFPGAVKYAY